MPHNNEMPIRHARIDQARVPGVQRPHRGHATDRSPGLPSGPDDRSDLFNRVTDFHNASPSLFFMSGESTVYILPAAWTSSASLSRPAGCLIDGVPAHRIRLVLFDPCAN